MINKQIKKVLITKDGNIVFIHDDDLAQMMVELGKITITRASNVEPDESGKWNASMMDGTILGPFNRRDQALAEEVNYLNKKLFKGESH